MSHGYYFVMLLPNYWGNLIFEASRQGRGGFVSIFLVCMEGLFPLCIYRTVYFKAYLHSLLKVWYRNLQYLSAQIYKCDHPKWDLKLDSMNWKFFKYFVLFSWEKSNAFLTIGCGHFINIPIDTSFKGKCYSQLCTNKITTVDRKWWIIKLIFLYTRKRPALICPIAIIWFTAME